MVSGLSVFERRVEKSFYRVGFSVGQCKMNFKDHNFIRRTTFQFRCVLIFKGVKTPSGSKYRVPQTL